MERVSYMFRGFLLLVAVVFVPAGMAEQSSKSKKVTKFAWPTEGKARVTQTLLKSGKTAVVAYDLLIRQDPETKNRIVTRDNYAFLKLNKIDLKKQPQLLEKIKPTLSIDVDMPILVIAENGDLHEVKDAERLAERHMQQSIAASKDANNAKAINDEMRADLSQMVELEATTVWNSWVSWWLDTEVTDDGELSYVFEQEVYGQVVPWDVSVFTMPPEPDLPKGSARFYMDMKVQQGALKAAYTALMKAKSKEWQVDIDMSKAELSRMEQSIIIDVATNPDTLQPIWVVYEEYSKIQLKGKRRQEKMKRYKYEFDWSAN